MATTDDDKAPLVAVFEAPDAAILPLATTALEQAGIEYGVRLGESRTLVGFGYPVEFGDYQGGVEIVVRQSDAARAKDLLADLEKAGAAGAAIPASSAPPAAAATPPHAESPAAVKTVRLVDADSGRELGRITEAQLDFLVGELEEENATDHDYYIDANTIDLLAAAGADAALLEILRTATKDRDGVEIAWEEE
jgi:processive 1,2-diacylglycerol beta-glucosyltransferase